MEEVATEEVGVATEGVAKGMKHSGKAAGRSTPRGPPLCNISCLCRRRSSLTLSSPRRPRTYYYPRIQSSSNFRT